MVTKSRRFGLSEALLAWKEIAIASKNRGWSNGHRPEGAAADQPVNRTNERMCGQWWKAMYVKDGKEDSHQEDVLGRSKGGAWRQ